MCYFIYHLLCTHPKMFMLTFINFLKISSGYTASVFLWAFCFGGITNYIFPFLMAVSPSSSFSALTASAVSFPLSFHFCVEFLCFSL